MTTLIVWTSKDDHGRSAIRLGADSRFTLDDRKPIKTWDYGNKLFASSRYPDMFGYSGHVIFASSAIAQVCAASDAGLIKRSQSPEERAGQFRAMIADAFKALPSHPKNGTTVLYCTRDGAEGTSDFSCWRLDFLVSGESTVSAIDLGLPKDIRVESFGTGAEHFNKHFRVRSQLEHGRSTMAVYWTLAEVIGQPEDPFTGGLPQLAVISRKHSARPVGVLHNEKLSILGLEQSPERLVTGISMEWRNDNFEQINPVTRQVKGSRYIKDALPQ